MAVFSSQPVVPSPVAGDEHDAAPFAACPMCHTPTWLTQAALEAGAHWRCVTCGQRWDARRLSIVAGYAVWVLEHGAAAPQTAFAPRSTHQAAPE